MRFPVHLGLVVLLAGCNAVPTPRAGDASIAVAPDSSWQPVPWLRHALHIHGLVDGHHVWNAYDCRGTNEGFAQLWEQTREEAIEVLRCELYPADPTEMQGVEVLVPEQILPLALPSLDRELEQHGFGRAFEPQLFEGDPTLYTFYNFPDPSLHVVTYLSQPTAILTVSPEDEVVARACSLAWARRILAGWAAVEGADELVLWAAASTAQDLRGALDRWPDQVVDHGWGTDVLSLPSLGTQHLWANWPRVVVSFDDAFVSNMATLRELLDLREEWQVLEIRLGRGSYFDRSDLSAHARGLLWTVRGCFPESMTGPIHVMGNHCGYSSIYVLPDGCEWLATHGIGAGRRMAAAVWLNGTPLTWCGGNSADMLVPTACLDRIQAVFAMDPILSDRLW